MPNHILFPLIHTQRPLQLQGLPQVQLKGIAFLPLAVESLGAWHPSAVAEVKRLGSALARHTGEEESTTICRLFQKLSICLMRGNAALFNNRSPPDQAALGDEIVW